MHVIYIYTRHIPIHADVQHVCLGVQYRVRAGQHMHTGMAMYVVSTGLYLIHRERSILIPIRPEAASFPPAGFSDS